MKRVLETAECEEVRNSIKIDAEIRKAREPNEKMCRAVELKVSDWQMNMWTSWACDTVKGQRWRMTGV